MLVPGDIVVAETSPEKNVWRKTITWCGWSMLKSLIARVQMHDHEKGNMCGLGLVLHLPENARSVMGNAVVCLLCDHGVVYTWSNMLRRVTT